ncbi:transposase [Actinomadura fulvescens]|uniref:Mutator family transposase n=1 Tax=Actinomadura fulvescens TaxID=46160 RepID=A0ABN3PZY7_9ACTN
MAQVQKKGLPVSGEGGLLAQLAKLVLESSLEGEMDAHLGCAKNDTAGRNSGNSRNGKRAKTVLTEAGPVEIEVPRDRGAGFEPQIVRKRQRRLDGIDAIDRAVAPKKAVLSRTGATRPGECGGCNGEGVERRCHHGSGRLVVEAASLA